MRARAFVASSSIERDTDIGTQDARILVDADACPVRDEIVTVARRHDLGVIFVANRGLRPSRDPAIRNVTVGGGFDAADDWIAGEARPGDIVVTADIPLVSRCVAAGALAVSPLGRIYAPENVGVARAMRDLNQALRESGAITGQNAPVARADRSRFVQALEQAVRRAKAADRS